MAMGGNGKEGIEAKYENGVLSITVPKKEEVQPREIPVSGN